MSRCPGRLDATRTALDAAVKDRAIASAQMTETEALLSDLITSEQALKSAIDALRSALEATRDARETEARRVQLRRLKGAAVRLETALDGTTALLDRMADLTAQAGDAC